METGKAQSLLAEKGNYKDSLDPLHCPGKCLKNIQNHNASIFCEPIFLISVDRGLISVLVSLLWKFDRTNTRHHFSHLMWHSICRKCIFQKERLSYLTSGFIHERIGEFLVTIYSSSQNIGNSLVANWVESDVVQNGFWLTERLISHLCCSSFSSGRTKVLSFPCLETTRFRLDWA